MRPIGTALSMAIQRRWGRATKLTVALFLLGTATVGMAFLPSYNTIGAHAITLLAVFRCLQGLAFGGSWDGLPSLLALNAPPNRRGWYSMMGQLGAPVGFMVASAQAMPNTKKSKYSEARPTTTPTAISPGATLAWLAPPAVGPGPGTAGA